MSSPFFLIALISSCCLCVYYHFRFKCLNRRDIEGSLDLATSTQLLKELYNRPNFPFILILPPKPFQEPPGLTELIVSQLQPDEVLDSLSDAEKFVEAYHEWE